MNIQNISTTRRASSAPKSICALVLTIGLLSLAVITGHAGYPNNISDSEDEYLSKAPSSGSLPIWKVSEPYINLWICAAPLAYDTSWGGTIGFQLAYKQRNSRTNNTSIFGLGSNWESSWLSFIKYRVNNGFSPPQITVTNTYLPLGGERIYVPDGITKQFKSDSTMTQLTNGSGNLIGFRIDRSDGSQDVYDYLFNVTTNENYAFLSQNVDSVAHTNKLNYDTISGVVRLRTMVDFDNRTNTISYNGTFTAQISQVQNHYGALATFAYDSSGKLTNIVNAESQTGGFLYDSQGLITNLVTAYGTAKFKATTNSFAPYNLGGTNQVNRSIEVTENDGTKQLFLYRDQSTKLNSSSSVDLIATSYPSAQVPNTSPLTNTLDNSGMDARNSFHWDRKQYKGLSTTFKSTGNFSDLTTNDYNLAFLSHWSRGFTNNPVVTDTLSLVRESSADGITLGQKTWFDYAGKIGSPTNWVLGTNSLPLFVALVLPDGTTRYTYTERNKQDKPTRIIATYASGSSVATRTNTLTYTSSAIDLVEFRGPSNELISSNSYNSFHQVLINYNAVNDLTSFTYDASTHQLTGISFPTELVTTNFYFTSGSHVNFLDRTIDYEGSLSTPLRTNSFTYTNGLVLTQTDPRGLISTNAYDKLLRATSLSDINGTVNQTFANLDLTKVVDRLSNTNQYIYNAMRQVIQHLDARGCTNSFGYSDPSGLTCVTNALLQEVNFFSFDTNQNLSAIRFADGNSATYVYNVLGQITKVTDSVGNSVTNWFNNQGLQYASSNAFGQISLSQYDLRDRPTNVVSADGVSVNMSYDNLGRLLSRTYPDNGIEKYGYSARGLLAYTNQLNLVTTYGYDSSGRLIAVTNANSEITRYTYSPAGDRLTLLDAKSQNNQFSYDRYGRLTNQIDAAGNTVLTNGYDKGGRLIKRFTPAKGNTSYSYDATGNLTTVDFTSSPDITLSYDAANRLTNMVDAAGTTKFSYTASDMIATEDGPWASDTVTSTYDENRMRASLAVLQPNATDWTHSYAYDAADRLSSLTSPAGVFNYAYTGTCSCSGGSLVQRLSLPNGAYITNTFDSVARLSSTVLKNSAASILNSHSYLYNVAGQRTKQTRTEGSFVDYTYDNIGQVKSAKGKESGGAARLNENYGYLYDAAHNLNIRTNNALIQTLTVDNRNQLSSASRSGTLTVAGTTSSNATSVTVNSLSASRYADFTFAKDAFTVTNGNNSFTAVAQDGLGRTDSTTSSAYLPASISYTYDSNGNLTSDGSRAFDYDDENELTRITVTNSWKSEFVYDGMQRRRVRKEFLWMSSAWVQTNEVRYVYDGSLVIQERDSNNVPLISYTRGRDLGGSLEAAGGIGGLLARTDHGSQVTSYFVADADGNVTALVSAQQFLVAKYLYDAFGNILSSSGPLAVVNLYRFSSKEVHPSSGLIYFGMRFYDPNLQRWLNRDPIGRGGNLFAYVGNQPSGGFDAWGLQGIFDVDDRSVTKDEIWNGNPPPGRATFPGRSSQNPFELMIALGVTYVDDESSNTSIETKTIFAPGVGSGCFLAITKPAHISIVVRYLAPDLYGFPSAQLFTSTIPFGDRLIWRGNDIDDAASENIHLHELEHVAVIKSFYSATLGVLQYLYGAFNTLGRSATSYEGCDAQVNSWKNTWNAYVGARVPALEQMYLRRQYAIDNKVIHYSENGSGFMRYLGDRPALGNDPAFYYNSGNGDFRTRSSFTGSGPWLPPWLP